MNRRRVPFIIVLVCVWAIPALLAVLEAYTYNRMAGRPFTLGAIVLRECAAWITYAAFTPLILRLANRLPLGAPLRWDRLAVHFSAATLIGIVAAAAATVATQLSRDQLASMRGMPTSRIFLNWLLGDLPVAFLSYFAVVGVAHAIRYATEARKRREDALRLQTQLAEARLTALQGRLHPHFLYNTLNAITVLVRDGDIVKSTRMLELLGEMLRRVLDRALPQIVPLRTELELLGQYLEIEQVRFSDRLTVAIDVDASILDAGVPALVMQPLVENVIRHAVAHTSRSVALRVCAHVVARATGDILELSVEDDGPGLTEGWQDRRAARTGLSATVLRLGTLYGANGSLDLEPGVMSGARSIVRIPYSRADNGLPFAPSDAAHEVAEAYALRGVGA